MRLYPGDEVELVIKGTIRKVHLDSEDEIIFTISNLNPNMALGYYWKNGMLQISEKEIRNCLKTDLITQWLYTVNDISKEMDVDEGERE